MKHLFTTMAVVAAVTMGGSLVDVDPARAELGAGGSSIGSGGNAIGKGAAQGETAAYEAAPRAVGGCTTNKTQFRTQTNQVHTASNVFAVMPNTHFPVTHAAGCLIVDFAGEMAAIGAYLEVRAWIGGIGAAEPPVVLLAPNSGADAITDTRSMRFVFPNVPAGTHTVRIDWKLASGDAFATRRTLTVMHR